MNSSERIHKIHHMLSNRRVVTTEQFKSELQISLSTLKRDLTYLKDRLNAPLKYDYEQGGYCFDDANVVGPQYEVPGLWFNDSELHALLMMQKLLEDVQPGLLAPHLEPMQLKLQAILCSMNDAPEEIAKRVLILAAGRRHLPLEHFETIATATIRRKRLNIVHFNRGANVQTQRIVSPQQMVYYRDNWYLDCWCHLRKEVRSFSIDAILSAELLTDKTKDLSIKKLREELGEGYGIFSGEPVQWAKLRIGPVPARWISRMVWHPEQKSSFDNEGHLLLDVPYSDDRELLQTILSWLPDVEVIAPSSLRKRLREVLEISLKEL